MTELFFSSSKLSVVDPEELCQSLPELPADAAVEDEVDGGVEDQEEVVGGHDEEEGDRHGVQAQLVAQVVVILSLETKKKRRSKWNIRHFFSSTEQPDGTFELTSFKHET